MESTNQPSAIEKIVNGAKKIGIYVAVGMAAMQAILFFVEELTKINKKPERES